MVAAVAVEEVAEVAAIVGEAAAVVAVHPQPSRLDPYELQELQEWGHEPHAGRQSRACC